MQQVNVSIYIYEIIPGDLNLKILRISDHVPPFISLAAKKYTYTYLYSNRRPYLKT